MLIGRMNAALTLVVSSKVTIRSNDDLKTHLSRLFKSFGRAKLKFGGSENVAGAKYKMEMKKGIN